MGVRLVVSRVTLRETTTRALLRDDVQALRLGDFGLDPVVKLQEGSVDLQLDQPPYGPPSMIRGKRMSYRIRGMEALEGLDPLPWLAGVGEEP